ncbi:MAG TPA: hypothetical protein DC058_24550 [Planctomycetaceae bacterium]|nr:hypothetical protein [Planctomycetaceae bacterium]HBC64372.1 hypothetical protein [Planctomycetaceae bacterium]
MVRDSEEANGQVGAGTAGTPAETSNFCQSTVIFRCLSRRCGSRIGAAGGISKLSGELQAARCRDFEVVPACTLVISPGDCTLVASMFLPAC